MDNPTSAGEEVVKYKCKYLCDIFLSSGDCHHIAVGDCIKVPASPPPTAAPSSTEGEEKMDFEDCGEQSAPDAGQPREYPRCTLCGASRIPRGEHGAGTCTLIGCKDPLFDNQVELRQAVMTNPLPDDVTAPSAPTSAARESGCTHTLSDRETAVADGYCPQCMSEMLEELRGELAATQESIAKLYNTYTHAEQRAQAAEAERDRLLTYAEHRETCVSRKRWVYAEGAIVTAECDCGLERLRKEAK